MKLLLDTVVQSKPTDSKVIIEEYIKPALINCNLLMSLICDVLNYATEDIDTRYKNPINIKPTDIRRDVLSGLFPSFAKRAEIRGIDFYSQIDANVPETFNTDPRRLIQILNNLIGNSMKFTFEGYIKIEVKQI